MNEIWAQYASANKGWIIEWVDISSASENLQSIPELWIGLVKNTNKENLKKIWKKAEIALPRFTGYLYSSIIDVRIVKSRSGYTLVYYLKDWEDMGIEGLEDGFMLAGLPIKDKLITHFENTVGKLPASLRELWSIHGFIERRDGTFITSLVEEQQLMVSAPCLYLYRQDEWNKGNIRDCLAIADVHGEIVAGISKKIDSNQWEDKIIDIMRYGVGFSSGAHSCLDDFLADTICFKWLNPGWTD